nr:hypothetical protein [uncultured Holophaga sp.]
MGRPSVRQPLILDPLTRDQLFEVVRRGGSSSSLVRAKVLLDYADGLAVRQIMTRHGLNRPRALRFIDQALRLGPLSSLKERRGRKPSSGRPAEAIAWLVGLLELSPSTFGFEDAPWSMKDLIACARRFGPRAGHPSLASLSKASAYRYFSMVGRPFRAA